MSLADENWVPWEFMMENRQECPTGQQRLTWSFGRNLQFGFFSAELLAYPVGGPYKVALWSVKRQIAIDCLGGHVHVGPAR